MPRKPKQEIDHQAEAKKVKELLEKQGWVAICSRVLGGEVVVWVRDAKVAVPTRWKNAVAYTLTGLQTLVAKNPTPEELRMIHKAKMIFNPKPGSVRNGVPWEEEKKAKREGL